MDERLDSGGPPPPLRVAFCHYTPEPGGGPDHALRDLVLRLPRARFTPLMLLGRGDPEAARYRDAGIQVEEFTLVHPPRTHGTWPRILYGARFWPSVFALEGALLRLRAEVVHVNTINNLIGPMAARLTGLPLVWHVREIGGGSRMERLQRWMAPRLAQRVLAVSEAVADSLPNCGDRLVLVRDGVDFERFQDHAPEAGFNALGLSPGTPVVMCIGRLEPWKGQHVLLEAVPTIKAARTMTVRAVDGVSLSIAPGEILGLVGESGCGKSTLARTIMQLEPPTSGDILLDGEPVHASNRQAMARSMQMVFQDPYASLNPRMTIGDTLAEPLRTHRVLPAREIPARVRTLLETVGLSARFIRKYPHEFSGGQRQRIAVDRALALEPHLILADEPSMCPSRRKSSTCSPTCASAWASPYSSSRTTCPSCATSPTASP